MAKRIKMLFHFLQFDRISAIVNNQKNSIAIFRRRQGRNDTLLKTIWAQTITSWVPFWELEILMCRVRGIITSWWLKISKWAKNFYLGVRFTALIWVCVWRWVWTRCILTTWFPTANKNSRLRYLAPTMASKPPVARSGKQSWHMPYLDGCPNSELEISR